MEAQDYKKLIEALRCCSKDKCGQCEYEWNPDREFCMNSMCAADWCERFGISDSTLWRRLTSGWSVEDALTRPKQKRKMEVQDG